MASSGLLGNNHNFSVPQQNENSNYIYLIGLIQGINGLIHGKHLE